MFYRLIADKLTSLPVRLRENDFSYGRPIVGVQKQLWLYC